VCCFVPSARSGAAMAMAMLLVYVATIMVGTRIGSLVLEHLHQAIEHDREDGAKKRPNPVDPVVARPNASDDGRSKRSGRVQRASGVVNTCGGQNL
jgi:hypothetical protein